AASHDCGWVSVLVVLHWNLITVYDMAGLFFRADDGIRDLVRCPGLCVVDKSQVLRNQGALARPLSHCLASLESDD
uniref:hypothetical protein n=1 Tax=Aeromonas caviae TaxID=648 RepID=UPI0025B6DC10